MGAARGGAPHTLHGEGWLACCTENRAACLEGGKDCSWQSGRASPQESRIAAGHSHPLTSQPSPCWKATPGSSTAGSGRQRTPMPHLRVMLRTHRILSSLLWPGDKHPCGLIHSLLSTIMKKEVPVTPPGGHGGSKGSRTLQRLAGSQELISTDRRGQATCQRYPLDQAFPSTAAFFKTQHCSSILPSQEGSDPQPHPQHGTASPGNNLSLQPPLQGWQSLAAQKKHSNSDRMISQDPHSHYVAPRALRRLSPHRQMTVAQVSLQTSQQGGIGRRGQRHGKSHIPAERA